MCLCPAAGSRGHTGTPRGPDSGSWTCPPAPCRQRPLVERDTAQLSQIMSQTIQTVSPRQLLGNNCQYRGRTVHTEEHVRKLKVIRRLVCQSVCLFVCFLIYLLLFFALGGWLVSWAGKGLERGSDGGSMDKGNQCKDLPGSSRKCE